MGLGALEKYLWKGKCVAMASAFTLLRPDLGNVLFPVRHHLQQGERGQQQTAPLDVTGLALFVCRTRAFSLKDKHSCVTYKVGLDDIFN